MLWKFVVIYIKNLKFPVKYSGLNTPILWPFPKTLKFKTHIHTHTKEKENTFKYKSIRTIKMSEKNVGDKR